jgi:hypothetical protein
LSKILWAASAVVASAGLAVGSVAAAAPTTTPVPFQETFPGYTGACDFPITVTFDTRQTMREWPGADGEAVRVHVTGPGQVTITNDENGRSVVANASGPTLTSNGKSKGTGHWVLIGRDDQADFLPFPPGAWLYTGRIGNLDAPSYADVFRGSITDLCAAVS